MTQIQNRLFELADRKYAEFQARLTPTVPPDRFIGVRVPALRQYAKELEKLPKCADFLETLPHNYYDENLLHSLLLNRMKNYDGCLAAVERFLPYVDNWAVCDTLRPKVFGNHKAALLPIIRQWAASSETYTCRFGIDMLMTYYLDNDFRREYLEIPAGVVSDEYYVNMMIAWFFATALAKQWDDTVPYLEQGRLPVWVHNKTIQKACESYRITDLQKKYLRILKMN